MNRNLKVFHELFDALQFVSIDGLQAKFALITDTGSFPDSVLERVLPGAALASCALIGDQVERRHFLFRRCFQQLFVLHVTGWEGAPRDLPLVHRRDTPPHCTLTPDLRLSFSSSATTYLFGASETHDLGVDIERIRTVENSVGLAQRFFSPAEASIVASCDVQVRSLVFLQIWSAKEAALKAVGRGIDSGLNAFCFGKTGDFLHILPPEEVEQSVVWRLEQPHWLTDHTVAVMHRCAAK